jgi:Mpv17 / PMP22 family
MTKWLPGFCIAACAFCSIHSLFAPSRNPYLTSLRGTTGKATASSVTLLVRMGNLIRSRPLLRNSLACMCLSAIGDLLAQRFELFQQRTKHSAKEENKSEFDLMDVYRTVTLASFGLLIAGPLYSMWYPFLDGVCHPWSLTKYGVWATPVVKMIIEMTFLEPVFLSLFFGFMNLAEGGNIQSFQQKMSSEFLPTYKTSLTVWPPYMLLSFRFVPVGAQTIAMNLAMAFWDAFLSYQNSRTTSIIISDGLVPIEPHLDAMPTLVVPSPVLPFLRGDKREEPKTLLLASKETLSPTFAKLSILAPVNQLGQPLLETVTLLNNSIPDDDDNDYEEEEDGALDHEEEPQETR